MSLRTSFLLLAVAVLPCLSAPARPSVQEIIQKSVEANQRDFEAAVHFNHTERTRTPQGSKTFQVTMIEGSPYERLVAVNGKPISAQQQADELKKEQQARKDRASESPDQHRKRVSKFEKERERDNAMMNQLTKAFNFALVGQRRLRSFSVYVLKATPKPGYQPPNMACQVLPGMQGELWIDSKTFQWVQVTAEVIRPVSIEGFLAQVQPGTRFQLNKEPVGDGRIWLVSHFSMKSRAKVLFMVNKNSEEEDTFWNYRPAK